jgi:heme exporter protein D
MGKSTFGVKMNWQDFFAMGGYAFYVWMSYGITVIVLLVIVITPIVQRRQFMRQQLLRLKRQEKS